MTECVTVFHSEKGACPQTGDFRGGSSAQVSASITLNEATGPGRASGSAPLRPFLQAGVAERPRMRPRPGTKCTATRPGPRDPAGRHTCTATRLRNGRVSTSRARLSASRGAKSNETEDSGPPRALADFSRTQERAEQNLRV